MKPIPAIIESDLAQHTAAIQAALRALREARAHEERAEQQAETARQVAARARLDLGRALVAARARWPSSGPKAKGWSVYLGEQRVDPTVALDAMRYAGFVEERFPGARTDAPGDLVLPTMREAGLDDRPRAASGLSLVPPPEPEIDRDTWCTPVWITDAIGKFDLDPCANELSHVQASRTFCLRFEEDGLQRAATIGHDWRVFVNPPYSNVRPWIDAYAHTRFVFLLKLDPSTKWFAELIKHTELILLPRGERVSFEPPPGIPPERANAQPFPHALFYAHAADATDEIRALCWAWRVERDATPIT